MISPSTRSVRAALFGTGVKVLTSIAGMRCREARDGHPVRRTTDVIKACLGEKRNTVRIPTMLATDANLEVWARRPSQPRCQGNQLPDALNVQGDKGVLGEDPLAHVGWQEATGVIPAHPQRRLR